MHDNGHAKANRKERTSNSSSRFADSSRQVPHDSCTKALHASAGASMKDAVMAYRTM